MGHSSLIARLTLSCLTCGQPSQSRERTGVQHNTTLHAHFVLHQLPTAYHVFSSQPRAAAKPVVSSPTSPLKRVQEVFSTNQSIPSQTLSITVMEQEPYNSKFEASRPYNPWKKFTQRKEAKHRAEDQSRLCPAQATSAQVIRTFFLHESRRLDDLVPRQLQILQDFLKEVVLTTPEDQHPPYETDITRRSANTDTIALLDDRQNHPGCARLISKPCDECRIFSQELDISALCERLKQNVSDPEHVHLKMKLNSPICDRESTSKQRRG